MSFHVRSSHASARRPGDTPTMLEIRGSQTGGVVPGGRANTGPPWDEFTPAAPNQTWYAYYAFLGNLERRAATALVLVALAGREFAGTVTLEFEQTLDGDPLAPDRRACACSRSPQSGAGKESGARSSPHVSSEPQPLARPI